ncbi:hypothetical protein HJC23_003030 [Cyclotella cryptica]|uniref:Pre-mRNA-processing factor 19 n=1 Tax=Cyclotella cryptica TaxID=29204 RepID=A0ABD3PYT5_9STRA|eukprot:CCRYP_010188-RA/>CCRYP_010188-RA protein AED:0.30 eAED:0.30 QI:0/0/0/1/1/1/2/0/550
MAEATSVYTCSLSGLPATNPVVTPSGHICSKSLLLTKLSENGGLDPFDNAGKRTLDESDLIELSTEPGVVPPRPPSATSLPSLLKILQSEFDAVLLELYDTRKALEETRRELSTALYQNDAAVRVIARVCGERDELAGRLEGLIKSGAAAAAPVADSVGGTGKRARDDQQQQEEEEEEPSKKHKGGSVIPASDLQAMVDTWSALSSARRTLTKTKRSPEEISAFEESLGGMVEKKVNLHKSNSNGVLGLCSVVWRGEEVVLSIGRDGQILVYNVNKGVICASVACAGVEGMHATVIEDTLFVCAFAGNEVKLFSVQEDEGVLLGSIEIDPPVNVTIHPSSATDAVRILVGTSNKVILLKYANQKLETLTSLDDPNHDSKYTTGAMHPDGLIYAAGTEGGKLIVWDLKTQTLAMALNVSEGNPVTNIAFSENGYHVATSTPSSILIWDLRKQKIIGTIQDTKTYALSFDPTASYLAYAGEGFTKVCVCKDWDRVICTLEFEHKSGKGKKQGNNDNTIKGGVVWGKGVGEGKKMCLVTCSDGEKPLRFWGVE